MNTRSTPTRRIGARLAVPVVAAMLLAGCTADTGGLSSTYESGSGDYVSADARLITLAPENRDPAVAYAGTLDTGDTIDSGELEGRVVVVNFWYAACPPCREEAPDLEKLRVQFEGHDVTMLGVNVSDSAGSALTFAEQHGVGYPSIIDYEDNAVQLAFAGNKLAQNSVPTTLLIDREGRVAARYSGLITSPSVIAEIVDDLLAETA